MIMNRTIRFIIICTVSIVIGYIAYFLFRLSKYGHSINWEDVCKKYTWIFTDSVRNELDTSICLSCVNKRDIINNYLYKSRYTIIFWEVKDFASPKLGQISFKQGCKLSDIKFHSGQLLNKNSSKEITIKFGYKLDKALNVCLDDSSEIDTIIESYNYKGFYGVFNKISFNDNKGNPQILINYAMGKEPGLFLVYIKNDRLYLIIINSKDSFDKDIIKITPTTARLHLKSTGLL